MECFVNAKEQWRRYNVHSLSYSSFVGLSSFVSREALWIQKSPSGISIFLNRRIYTFLLILSQNATCVVQLPDNRVAFSDGDNN